ncbi:DNA-processing protein DprA [Streptococcus catagoni]|uniref:DNA-processing protein DprA n=1 Tax=Streptococcus catagoni TaxID=2654874 RepID=UPI00140C0358|nr:DNA-processing protein DprA [Streptococcus catagoni]
MNNFEIYKLRSAGLKNNQILKVLDYQKQYGKKLTIRNMAVISECKHPILFMEAYKSLDLKELRREFMLYPSLSILDKEYPQALRQIFNPPVLLFYQGNIALLEKPKLAVIGSRKATEQGIESVRTIINQLQNKFLIVSGLARGIDTAAHLSILKNGGSTIAVIGCGFNYYYPKENKKLQTFIAKNHLLISEYGPEEKPLSYHFPERNRIIAGLSLGVLVAEAKYRSGSLITCNIALEEGRDVFAIPSNIIDGNSDGCHQLIKEGAKCITSGLDILMEYQNI